MKQTKHIRQFRQTWLPAWMVLCLAISVFESSLSAQSGERRGRGPGGFGGAQQGERIEPEDLTFDLGVGRIPDRKTFEKLSYKGPDVMRDAYLADLEFVKFIIEAFGTDKEKVYFMNTNNHRAHPRFMPMVGINRQGAVRGALTYLPRLTAPDKDAGLYIMDFEPFDSYTFEEIKAIRKILTEFVPILKGKVAFHPLEGNVERYRSEKAKYDASDVAVHLDEDLYRNISYLPLNMAESFGLLRVMDNETRPSPRDIVICQTLPNQMPRVAGVISEVRQTPLSHVNLRAVQDKIPNAFIKGALQKDAVKSLVGKLVFYRVSDGGFNLREASQNEVDEHFKALRPTKSLIPVRDLSKEGILPLNEIAFEDASGFGVKSSNLATMHSFELPEGTFPNGFAMPFYFYDKFMSYNGFYQKVDEMLADEVFQSDREVQRKKLKNLRSKIEKGKMPGWMLKSIEKLQKSFGEGISIRCRSSTNNEDLPGFSGAGLYDSYTHHPREGHLSKSVRQVFASLWNFRAFEEREFYRIDHKKAAMGVLFHPNFKGEKANGVAVTDDIIYETQGNYYLNTQMGEDLVTNPDGTSSPEEILLGWWERDGHEIVRRSTEAKEDGLLLSVSQLDELRDDLARIHARFRTLYGHGKDDVFAMEIEYKITEAGDLLIKQARPWVY